MGSDDCEQVARSANIALEILVRAYHALAVMHELSNPGSYAALHGMMMPYLRDGFRLEDARNFADPHVVDMVSSALDRIRCVLDDIRSDVAAIRNRPDEPTG